jgi:hypothetical protein
LFFYDHSLEFHTLINTIKQRASAEADAMLFDGRLEQVKLVEQNKLLCSEVLNRNETILELNHTIARRRQELHVYEVKLKDWKRREEIAMDVSSGHTLFMHPLFFSFFLTYFWQFERSLMQREAIVAANERSLQVFIVSP